MKEAAGLRDGTINYIWIQFEFEAGVNRPPPCSEGNPRQPFVTTRVLALGSICKVSLIVLCVALLGVAIRASLSLDVVMCLNMFHFINNFAMMPSIAPRLWWEWDERGKGGCGDRAHGSDCGVVPHPFAGSSFANLFDKAPTVDRNW